MRLLSKAISNSDITYLRRVITRWGKKNFSEFPWRKTHNRWHALTAEIMLQRTKAEQVLSVYNSFATKYNTPEDYLNDKDASVFETLGLKWRENELRKLAKILSVKVIPTEKEELLALPGIGNYIAAAFRSFHLNIRDVLIDSNIVRLYGRFFGFDTDGETRRKKWFVELSNQITPRHSFWDFNYALIDFTRTVCKPKPLCETCILKHKCKFFKN